MENYKDIIIRPIITEKTMRYMDADNKVTFEVNQQNTGKAGRGSYLRCRC